LTRSPLSPESYSSLPNILKEIKLVKFSTASGFLISKNYATPPVSYDNFLKYFSAAK